VNEQGHATFAPTAHQPDQLVALLTDAGFVPEPPRPVLRSMLDTFDGGLHAAGLRLELREGKAAELLLAGRDAPTARLLVADAPRTADELPAGPFRSRIAAASDHRALLKVVGVRAIATRALRRDADGKIVAIATIYENLAVDDHPTLEITPWTVEVEAVRGFEKHARTTRATLVAFGLRELGHDTLVEAARAAGARIGAAPGPSDVELHRSMPAIDGCRAVLSGLADTVAANWQGTIDETDIEFLHDLRIGVRRTRTVLGECKHVLPRAVRKNARATFARLGAVTGPPRDLDVYLVEWSTYTEGLDADTVRALEPVRDVLRRRRDAAHVELAQALRDPRSTAFMEEWRRWLAVARSHEEATAKRALDPLGEVVAKRILRAHGRLIADGRSISPDTPADRVHDLRKDAKKLRYLLECFATVLATGPRKRFVRRLKDLQDNLGVHQDAEVHVATLREIADELHATGVDPQTLVAMGQLTERIDQRRIAARAEFAARFAAFDTAGTRRELERALHEKHR
jgi:CHAD domain-containing protein